MITALLIWFGLSLLCGVLWVAFKTRGFRDCANSECGSVELKQIEGSRR